MESTMLRTTLATAAEIASLATFGTAVGMWALILGPLA
jgi:hypothetical protein